MATKNEKKQSQVEAALGGQATPVSSAPAPVDAPEIQLPPGYKPAGPISVAPRTALYHVAVATDQMLADAFGVIQTASGPKPAHKQMAKFGMDGGFSNVSLYLSSQLILKDGELGPVELHHIRFNVNGNGDVSGPFWNQDTGNGQYRAGRNDAISKLRAAATNAPPEYSKALEGLLATAGRSGKALVVYDKVDGRTQLMLGGPVADINAFLAEWGDFFRAEAAKVERIVTRAEKKKAQKTAAK